MTKKWLRGMAEFVKDNPSRQFEDRQNLKPKLHDLNAGSVCTYDGSCVCYRSCCAAGTSTKNLLSISSFFVNCQRRSSRRGHRGCE